MRYRTVRTVSAPSPMAGPGILRPFPSRALPHIDPFVFLDTGTPKHLGDQSIYVGPHAHRGVQPVSLVFRARIQHRDSMGNDRTVESGGMQWLVSGSGALHEEVLWGDEEGVFHMAQLWVNVPARLKMNPPEHHAVAADQVPEFAVGEGVTLRLYAGTLDGHTGPAPLPTPVLIGHAILGPGGDFSIPVPAGWTAAFTVVAGSASAEGEAYGPGATPVFHDDGDAVRIQSDAGGQVLVMMGEPIGEPVVFGGGFVMNTAAEIERAFEDLQAGEMGRLDPR